MAEAALRHRLATVFEYCGYVNAGGLMSFGANLREKFQRAADYVDRLLEGAKPSSLPVDQAARSSW